MDKSSNPAFSKKNVAKVKANATSTEIMTVNGSLAKTGILLALVVAFGVWTWNFTETSPSRAWPLIIGASFAAMIVAIVTIFKKPSPLLSVMYAVFQGIVLGGISQVFNEAYSGIVLQAILLTLGITLAMLGLYKTGIIKVTAKFKSAIILATVGVLFFYLITWIIGIFSPAVYEFVTIGTSGVIIAAVIVLIAALNLIIDFDFIDQGAKQKLPKDFEWYAAFGLMVTLIWLYISILRLLFASRN